MFLKCLSPIVAKSTAAQMIKMVSFSSFSSFNTNIEIKLNISLVQLFVFLSSTCLYFSHPLVCISLARLFVLLSSIFIFSVVDCLPRLSWITWCYHMRVSTHHAKPVKEGRTTLLEERTTVKRTTLLRTTLKRTTLRKTTWLQIRFVYTWPFPISQPVSIPPICFPSSIGLNLSKFGSTVLNVEYLFVQPAFLRCRQHCKREDEKEDEEEEE